MMRTFLLASCALLALSFVEGLSGADAPAVQAVVVTLKGPVTLQRGDAKKTVDAKKGDFLYAGDTLFTGISAQAEIALTGGVIVRINQKSEFKTTGSKGGTEQNAGMKAGQIWTRVIHGKAQLRVTTPTAVAAVRGTEADISQRETLTVKVYDGIVDVINPFGRTTLKQGEMSTVAGPDKAPEPAQQMGNQDQETWHQDLQSDTDLEDLQKGLEQEAAQPQDKTLRLKIDKDGEEKTLRIKFKKGEQP